MVDEAAPRREELPDTEDGVEVPTTPSVPQAQFMNVISPPGSRLGTAGVGGSASESSYGGHGITSPGSMSHHGTSPTLGNSFPADAQGMFLTFAISHSSSFCSIFCLLTLMFDPKILQELQLEELRMLVYGLHERQIWAG